MDIGEIGSVRLGWQDWSISQQSGPNACLYQPHAKLVNRLRVESATSRYGVCETKDSDVEEEESRRRRVTCPGDGLIFAKLRATREDTRERLPRFPGHCSRRNVLPTVCRR
jgi:hypothetical protein